MKKLFVLLMLCIPFVAWAKDKRDDTPYLKGAVPEVNGQVKFQQAFAVKGKSKAEIYQVMKNFIQQMTKEPVQMQGTKMVMEDEKEATLVGRFEEWMEFKRKPLVLDRTRFRYLYTIQVEEGKCSMNITQISYYYEEDNDGYNGRTYRAEEWINDANALNKAQTKLLYGSAKFRRKTVDRVKDIFEKARAAFEQPVKETQRATQLLDN